MAKSSIELKLIGVAKAANYSLKLIIKNVSPMVGSFLLRLNGGTINKEGYEKRILIMFGGGVGDVAKRSVICEYVREYLSGYEVSYLMPYKISFPYAKENIYFDYGKAKINPGYYAELARSLRRTGFSKVIVLLPAWEGFLVSLGAAVAPEALYRYTEAVPRELIGFASFMVRAFQSRQKNFRDIPVMSYFDERWKRDYFPSDVHKMAYFFSQVICDIDPANARHLDERGLLTSPNLRTEVVVDATVEKNFLAHLAEQYPLLDLSKCCLIGLGSSTAFKNWPTEKFAQAAKALHVLGMDIAIIDPAKDAGLIEQFATAYGAPFFSIGIGTNLDQLLVLIKHGALVMSNDTAFVHLAVALKKPAVCVCRDEQVGADSCYGYEDINTWVFGKHITDIKVQSVVETAEKLFSRLRAGESLPRETFVTSYFEQFETRA